MCIIYGAVVVLAALATSYAAVLNFVGAESVYAVADRIHVSRTWMRPLGTLLASAALGLLAGFVVPHLGEAAALGLVLYFVGALGAHVRAHDREVAAPIIFLVLAIGALIAELGYCNHGC
jgi:hypothetical protein